MMRALALLLLTLLAGCFTGTSGIQMTPELLGQLHDGMSPEEVEKVLGAPQLRQRDTTNGSELWFYSYAVVHASAFSVNSSYQSDVTKLQFTDGRLVWKPRTSALGS